MHTRRAAIVTVLALALSPPLLARDRADASTAKPTITAITHVTHVCAHSPHITATVTMTRLAEIPYTLVADVASGSGSPSYSQSFTPTTRRETLSVYFSSNGKYPKHSRSARASQTYDVRLLWSGHEGQQTSAAKKFKVSVC